jgi:6-phosphogluconolactonase
MKFSKLSQLFLVSAMGLLAAVLLSGCLIVTIDYVYVADSTGNSPGSSGQIQIFAADAESGALRPADKTVSSGGSHPVSLAVTSDYASLYVANQGNNSIVHFGIANSGALTEKDKITTSGSPVAMAINPANTYLYVISGTSSATLTEYSLGSGGAIGSAAATQTLVLPGYAGDNLVPTAVTALPNPNFSNNNALYVAVYDQSAYNPGGTVTSSANPGWIFGYTVGSGGALTPATGSPWLAGVKPVSLAPDPTNRLLYATDYASNHLIGYTIQSGGRLAFMVDGPFTTGNEPTSAVVDPRGTYIYVADSLQSTLSAFSISLPTGTPSAIINTITTGINTTDTDPVQIIMDPALGRFIYTANYLGNSISGFRINPNNGNIVSATQNTPYPTGANPTAIVAVPHGNHATQAVTP